MRKKRNRYKRILEKPFGKKKRGVKVMYKYISRNWKKAREKSEAASDGQLKI